MALFNDYKAAIFATLNADPLLQSRIFQVLNQEQPYPKLWIEDSGAVDWSDNCQAGLNAEISVHIGSKYAGDKEINAYMQACHNRLHQQNLLLLETQCVLCQYAGHTVFFDPDGVTRHAVIRFSLLISE